jgi:hypothetical protein
METSALMNTKQMLSDKEIKIFVHEAMKSLTKFMGQVHDTYLTLVMQRTINLLPNQLYKPQDRSANTPSIVKALLLPKCEGLQLL